tara:strand:- start:120 stop:989 length:870 start_codon:yes stop_codon:yes gene_type:complete
MQDLNIINSIIEARYKTGKPTMSAKLMEQHQRIIFQNGASGDAVGAPPAKLFAKGGPITDARNIINNFGLFIRDKGMPVPDKVGWTFQKAEDVDDIQSEFDGKRDELDRLLLEIRGRYDTLVAEGGKRLGQLVDEVRYPDVEEFLDDFKFKLRWSGTSTDISKTGVMGAVSSETAARIRATQQTTEDTLKEAHGHLVRDAVNEMADVVEALLKGKRLRQERIDKLAKASEEIHRKNWLQLPELTSLVNTLRDLTIDTSEIPTEELRREHARKVDDAKSEAEKTLAALGV